MVWSLAKVAPPVSTVIVALPLPSSVMVAVSTVTLKLAASSSVMPICTLPIAVAPWLAAISIVSLPSTRLSSTAVTVALPSVAPGAIVMLAGVIV